MSTKLIQTDLYLLLIDEEVEVKEGDFAYCQTSNSVIKWSIPNKADNNRSKIIAYYPLTEDAKELDLPLLPNPFKEVDIEELSDKVFWSSGGNYDDFKDGFIKGYKAAQAKQFSLEDMKKAFEASYGTGKYGLDTFIQSLSTQQLPKEFVLSDKFNTFEENIKHGKYIW